MTTDETYQPGVDVVVVNYRTPEDLRGFIRSFKDVQYEVPATLHVVNVDPTPDDMRVAEVELADILTPVSFSVHPSNVGYAKACNGAAMAIAQLDTPRQTIAFFNADTRLRPGVLDHCHWHLHQNLDWGIIGPKQIDEAGRITHSGIFGTHERPELRGWKQQDRPDLYDELRSDAVSVSGSAYFVKRYCWDALNDCQQYREVAPDAEGAFLPTCHYYEETWCSYHAAAHGWKIAYDGRVTMVHKWHQASPVGGIAERNMPKSREFFRRACDHHQIKHD